MQVDWSIAKGDIWNYHGNKKRYLTNILSVLPKSPNLSFIDLFTGGSSVATSLDPYWIVTANDIESRVVDLSKELQALLSVYSPEGVEEIVRNHCRSRVSGRTDAVGYEALKLEYNNGNRSALNLYALTMASNSNMIRFNPKGGQNLKFGKRYYSDTSSAKMLSYLNRLLERDVTFTSKDFRTFKVTDYDIWIIDPPYKTSKATYSENGQWSIQDEVALLALCDKINAEGKKFIYFNQTFTQGRCNKVVNSWKDKYKCITLADTTSNCSAQRKITGITTEIMVHNF